MEEFNTGDRVEIINVGTEHLFDYVGKQGNIISYLIMSVGDPKRYKVLFEMGEGIQETAYFLGNEMIKI